MFIAAGTVEHVIRHVVVGVDGSKGSAAAVQWVADLAHVVGASVTAVHAADLVERFQARAASQQAFEEEVREQVDRDWCSPLRHRGVVYDVVVRAGPAATMLMDVAAGAGDLIVVGRRGDDFTDIGRLGSTSQELAAVAKVPVVVIASPSTT